jgi:hypothetical protein
MLENILNNAYVLSFCGKVLEQSFFLIMEIPRWDSRWPGSTVYKMHQIITNIRKILLHIPSISEHLFVFYNDV